MAKTNQSLKVPKKMQAKYDSIVAITDQFAQEHLNEDYAQLIRQAAAALARKRPSPLERGQAKSWACGITHAIGMVNFLYDPAHEPYIAASELYKLFGVSQSNGLSKSKMTRDLLDMWQLDPDWSTQAMIQRNPLNATVVINGQIVDASMLPRELQEILHEKGILPIIPAESAETDSELLSLMADSSAEIDSELLSPMAEADDHERTPLGGKETDIFCFEVYLINGMLTDDFIENNPVVRREIEIRGSQTLADFHRILFKAFDREDEHMYEFQVRGSAPNDPKAERYVLPMAMDDIFGDNKPAGCVNDTAIASLDLAEEDVIGYWFDFGDDWWHAIYVLEIHPPEKGKRYPRITAREGASPPQYPDFDEL